MTGLMHTLGVGSNSLLASRQGLDTTAHNISNAQTEGYSRQRMHLTARPHTVRGGLLVGNGAFVNNVRRYHNRFLENQRNEANSNFGEGEARKSAMLNLETVFSPELDSISEGMSRFFESLQNLSAMPEENSLRIDVREKGDSLAAAFRTVDGRLEGYRENINDQVAVMTDDLTKIIKEVASLNQQVLEAEKGTEQVANDLRDQRDRMIRELSSRVNIHYYEDSDGMVTIRGPSEALLVDRNTAADFSIRRNLDNQGMFDVVVTDIKGEYSTDITNSMKSGKLNGLIDIRDNVVKGIWSQNNELAGSFAESFNEIHRNGFGVAEYRNSSGRNFFTGRK